MEESSGGVMVTQEEIVMKLTEVEQRSRSNTHQIEELKESTKILSSLALSVEKLAVKQEYTNESIDGIRKDLDDIKGTPARRWEKFVVALITALAGWAFGHFFL